MPKLVAILDLPLRADYLAGTDTFTVRRFDNLPALLALRAPPHALLLRAALPTLHALPEVRSRFPAAMVVLHAPAGWIGTGPDALRRGADCYLEDDTPPEEVRDLLARDNLTTKFRDDQRKALFHSTAMQRILADLPRLAQTDAPILITGETGTGKEVIANLVHEASARASKPFLKINCASLPRELIESELFGSKRGAYTGSIGDRPGLFVEASGGTLLLDELAEMQIETQPKLLRVLQDQEVRPVGSTVPVKVNVRIIASTNQPPADAIAAGHLRADLFYRLAILELTLPPLRERADDILPLFQHFLAVEAARHNLPLPAVAEDARSALLLHPWSGNIRELQAVAIRSLLRHSGETVLNRSRIDFGSIAARPKVLDREQLIELLLKHNGRQTGVARAVGLHPTRISQLCLQHGLNVADYRKK